MDIALLFDPATLSADIGMNGADLWTDDTLKTAVIISLFTDRRANADDILPDDESRRAGGGNPGSGDRRGWWGDWYSPEAIRAVADGGVLPAPTDRIGSRLWLLGRDKQLPETLQKAKEIVAEALAWMIEDNVASRVDVTTEIAAPDTLGILIQITEPQGTKQTFQFSYAWGGL